MVPTRSSNVANTCRLACKVDGVHLAFMQWTFFDFSYCARGNLLTALLNVAHSTRTSCIRSKPMVSKIGHCSCGCGTRTRQRDANGYCLCVSVRKVAVGIQQLPATIERPSVRRTATSSVISRRRFSASTPWKGPRAANTLLPLLPPAGMSGPSLGGSRWSGEQLNMQLAV